MKERTKKRRTAIVPRAVFAAAVAIGSVPALAGCSARGPTMSVAAFDLGFSVAAPRDLGSDSARDGSADGAPTDGGGTDFGFSVAAPIDMGPDLFFSVALPLDGGGAPDATFTVAALPDAFFSVAAPPPDAFFSVAAPAGDAGV